MLHPWIAFRFGNNWSKNNRLAHDKEYAFGGPEEPLYKFAVKYSSEKEVDYFIFGHYHSSVDMIVPAGARMLVLKDWIGGSPYISFDGKELTCISQE